MLALGSQCLDCCNCECITSASIQSIWHSSNA